MTAGTANYLIESDAGRVDLCESQGGQWITIQRDVSTAEAARFGFNLDSPAVRAVFTDACHFHGDRSPWGD